MAEKGKEKGGKGIKDFLASLFGGGGGCCSSGCCSIQIVPLEETKNQNEGAEEKKK